MLQLHLKQRPQKSSPLPLAHICSKRQVSLAQGYVSICVLVLFKAVSICLFTSTLKSQESLGQYECVSTSVPMCVHVCAGGRGQASEEHPVAGSIECCLHLAREGALGPWSTSTGSSPRLPVQCGLVLTLVAFGNF